MKTQPLKTGFTTGTAAAAAVKGALYLLLSHECKKEVTVPFLDNGSVTILLNSLYHQGDSVYCSVIKDGGDDPDSTHHAEIGAKVSITKGNGSITINGGKGVGIVTKAGLEIPPGQWAINPGPSKMIKQSVRDIGKKFSIEGHNVVIEIIVPKGEKLAKKTMNHRLGILGGISILGTTGRVIPLSHKAYFSAIKASLSVAQAAGVTTLFFTTGRRSERFAEGLFSSDRKESFVQIGDFFAQSIQTASTMKFTKIVLVVFFGKAVKMAQGNSCTHAAQSSVDLQTLSEWTFAMCGEQTITDNINRANSAREALSLLLNGYTPVIEEVGNRIVTSAQRFLVHPMAITACILDFDGKCIFHSDTNAEETIE